MNTKPRRILLVEDHTDSAAALTQVLRSMGHSVEAVGSCKSARAAFARDTFDLVLMDLGLPDGDGCDLLREFLAIRKIPAIAITGHGMDEDLARARDAGFIAHILKPLILPTLTEMLSNIHLDKARPAAESPGMNAN